MPYPNQHACRLRDPGDFQDGSFRTMHRDHEGKDYSVIVGKLKGETAMTEQAYRYDKNIWTAGSARSHCESHDGSFVAADDRPAPGDVMYPNKEILNFSYNSILADSEPGRSALGKNDKVVDFQGTSFKAQDSNAEIWLYDEIGSGWFGGMSAKQFADEFKKLGKVNNISLRINSPGGDVFDGLAIYNILKQSPSRITVYIDGLAASIASIIAMAGDEINMADNAIMMIHKAWGMAIGNSDEMQAMSDTLNKLDGTLVGTYAKQTGMEPIKIAEMMAAETWMTSQEALNYRFITNITDEMKLAAHFDLDKYKFKKNPITARMPMQPATDEDKGQPMQPDVSCFDEVISKCKTITEMR